MSEEIMRAIFASHGPQIREWLSGMNSGNSNSFTTAPPGSEGKGGGTQTPPPYDPGAGGNPGGGKQMGPPVGPPVAKWSTNPGGEGGGWTRGPERAGWTTDTGSEGGGGGWTRGGGKQMGPPVGPPAAKPGPTVTPNSPVGGGFGGEYAHPGTQSTGFDGLTSEIVGQWGNEDKSFY